MDTHGCTGRITLASRDRRAIFMTEFSDQIFRKRYVAEAILIPHPTSVSERVAEWLKSTDLSFFLSAMSRAGDDTHGELVPLLGNSTLSRKKPFHSARPVWLVQFALLAAFIRGMTLSSRVEVFTQVSCSYLHRQSFNPTSPIPETPFYYGALQPSGFTFINPIDIAVNDSEPAPPPSGGCKSDAAVQAGAARIQTMFTITSGLLSALTTGWWGHTGERFGRTKVLGIATLGWFLSDSFFILASAPSSPFAAHRITMVLLAPVFEGLLGGWSTIQSGCSAYISDCTPSGSRASIFSLFTGFQFLGFSLGPLLAGWIIRHPFALFSGPGGLGKVTSVFWVAAISSFINLCMILFVVPESVTKEQRDRASGRMVVAAGEAALRDPRKPGIIKEFFSPLAVFLPVSVHVAGSARPKKDWSLTLVTFTLFSYMLSQGLYQIKYFYGTHIYSWGPEQLSYYISFMGGGRAVFLLFVLPFVISHFKPKSTLPKTPSVPGVTVAKPKPTKAHLEREIKFDIALTRVSLCIDIAANAAIVLAPAPAFLTSQALFVVASSISSWGTGLIPSTQSLALSILQARALLEAEAAPDSPTIVDASTGKLFGAIALLQAAGQMVLGPLFFGLIYSGTVATFPKAVFVAVDGILFAAFVAMVVVRSPLSKGTSRRSELSAEEEEERGRSRGSKDLR
ncbi:major facilitator superfamily domain-containing protein, partial [Mycena haematopus]